MYETFYGLKTKPFSILPDPEFLYLGKKHRVALTMLEYALMNNAGFCVISGEIGAGKTTLLRKLLASIEENSTEDITIGMITNTHQSFGELLDWVLSAFGIHQPGLGKVEMHQRLVDFLLEQYAKNKTTLLIVDEAQNMPAATLEELRMLSNINSEKDLVLQVILSGQPELKDLLRKPELTQFAQRISVDFHLAALDSIETCHYIQHRLVTAGATDDIFTPEACRLIYSYSGGVPRLINLLCDTSLVYGFADQKKTIGDDLVQEMIDERMEHSILPMTNINKKEKSIDTDNDDFPWINPEGGTGGLKPAAEKKTLEKAASVIEQANDQANFNVDDARRVDENKAETAEPLEPVAAGGRLQQNTKAAVIPTQTHDSEQATRASPVKQVQASTPDNVPGTAGYVYSTARHSRTVPVDDQTEKSQIRGRLVLFALFMLAVFLSVSMVSYNYEAELPGSDESELSEKQLNDHPAEIELNDKLAEIKMLKLDLSGMHQQIKDMQRERDEALAKARLEGQRALEARAAIEATEREMAALAAADLTADEAQKVTRQAEQLAKQQRLENQRLRQQLRRLEQAKQQAEAKQALVEEQRKKVVLEWERIAKEKAALGRASSDWPEDEW